MWAAWLLIAQTREIEEKHMPSDSIVLRCRDYHLLGLVTLWEVALTIAVWRLRRRAI